jgi:hypothetical protein
MGERDHSIKCEKCGLQRGGLNDLKCDCDDEGCSWKFAQPTWYGTQAQADSARALIDALIYPRRDFEHAWEAATVAWGREGEAPARIALLEAALLEACEIAKRGKASPVDLERLGELQIVASR